MADSPRIEELRRRVQLDPASIAFAALAEEYRRAGRYEDAVATCEAGLQRHPAYLSARVTLGRALLGMGRVEAARDELEHVLRVAPENLAAIRGLAEIHQGHGAAPERAPADEGSGAPPQAPIESAPPERAAAGAEPVATSPVPLSVLSPAQEPVPVPAAHGPASAPDTDISRASPSAAQTAHPDEAALPDLEALLSAIRRARDTASGDETPPAPRTGGPSNRSSNTLRR